MLDGRRLGVVGAGVMGAGIAQLGAEAGRETLVYDPIADVATAISEIEARLDKSGRSIPPPVHVRELTDLADCDVIVEAIPERLELKQELFARLGTIAPEAILASNTSSIPITAIASAAPRPEQVVGMHFFNPPTLMRLVEVVPGVQSDNEAVQRIRDLAEAMGKRVIECADVVGFVVNRNNRAFSLEALRSLNEKIADVATIDRIYRVGGGFRMGPFELQDLVGIDTGHEVALSFYERSYGEPRWRPSPLTAGLCAAGWHGRKSGRGWYDYGNGASPSHGDSAPPAQTGGALVEGHGRLADALRSRAVGLEGPRIVVEGLGGTVEGERFHAIVPLTLVEVTGDIGEATFSGLGLHTARIAGGTPAGVLPRTICQLVNEAHFSLGENIACRADIDDGLVLGVNHPRGPLAWGELLGLDAVIATLGQLREVHGDAYRPAPALAAAAGLPLELAGAEEAIRQTAPLPGHALILE